MNYKNVVKYYRFLNLPSGDLRISITDKCNMKCSYCHNEGQQYLQNDHFLSYDDIMIILSYAIKYGVFKIRLTGGEPLIHPDIIKICRDIKAKYSLLNFGINTNAYNTELLEKLCKMDLFDQIVIGVDYFSGKISKESSIGPSPRMVLDVAKKLKKIGYNVEIASVYLWDDLNKIELIDFCLRNRILIKIIENTNVERMPDKRFYDFADQVLKHFGLKIGITVDLNQIYGIKDGYCVIKFFQSHCNRRECNLCKNLHLRVTSMGYARPCIFNNATEEYLLNPNTFDTNIRRAIINMGNELEPK